VVDEDAVAAVGQVEGHVLVGLLAAGAAVLVPQIDDLAVLDEGREALAQPVDALADAEVELFVDEALALEGFQVMNNEEGSQRVQARVWLIQDQQLRIVQDGARDGCFALHAFRVFPSQLVFLVQRKRIKQLIDALHGLFSRHAIQLREEQQVLARAEVVVERAFFGQVTNLAFHRHPVLVHIATHHAHAPGGRFDQPGHHLQRGALASAVMTDNADNFACAHFQAQVGDRGNVSFPRSAWECLPGRSRVPSWAWSQATRRRSVEADVPTQSVGTRQAPFAEVLVAMLFILPVTFISVFFTSSFMDEKLNRRLTILLSTPITPFQIIVGKMLPYAVFAMLSTIAIALATRANPLLALAIFAPAIFFIFAIYLMVPLLYRTFKDTTFISMLVTTLTTIYLVFPAMFNGVSDMAFMSPLTLAVMMYQGEPFTWREYLFPSLPMMAIFGLAMFAGTRLLNEEFLTGYRPLLQKGKDAIFLIIDREHPYISIALLSFLLIPVVYLVQLVALAFATNLPANFMLVATLVTAALVEEIVKSIGIVVLFEQRTIRSWRQVLSLALLSSFGFLAGEKLLLFFSVGSVAQSALSGAFFSTGLLLVPLLAHFIFTAAISLATTHLRWRYGLVLLAGAILHSLYNYALLGGL
jgi:ABC-type Na+ efflux pump permease subunit